MLSTDEEDNKYSALYFSSLWKLPAAGATEQVSEVPPPHFSMQSHVETNLSQAIAHPREIHALG